MPIPTTSSILRGVLVLLTITPAFFLIRYILYLIAFKKPEHEYRHYSVPFTKEARRAMQQVSSMYSIRIELKLNIIEILDTSGKWVSVWRLVTDSEKQYILHYFKDHEDFKSDEEKEDQTP